MDHDIPMSIKMGSKSFKGIKDLDDGQKIDEKPILELCDFADYRLDCADFRMVSILRTLYCYKDLLSDETIDRMEDSVLRFKYWMDEPGDDSMCYWSENHQILFFTCGYLAGRLYQGETFSNSGKSGLEMMEIFRPRILAWMEHRFEHGFIEWHSNTYYEEDIPPLTLLADFADEDLQKKALIILDLFVADMAMHNYKGLFSVSSGRCYEDQKREPLKQDVLEVSEYLFGHRYVGELDYSRISSNLYLSRNYRIPDVLREIAADQSPVVIKTSMGHDFSELKGFSREKGEETTGYIQWAMESFTNPPVIRRTMKMWRQYNMIANDFLKDFSMLDIKGIGFLLPLISRLLNPVQDGVAIRRADTYTYRTADYILSTAQNHYPGTFGDQQHIWQATLNENISVFTTHPGVAFFDDNARNFSPSYWVGNGVLPHSVQHGNTVLSIYDTRGRKGYMERSRADFTHAHFPFDKFDHFEMDGPYAFGRSGQSKVALIGRYPLERSDKDRAEIIQRGKVTFWICVMAGEEESYEDFTARIREMETQFKGKTLSFGNMVLRYKGSFAVDGETVNTTYRRLESPYGSFSRGDEEVEFRFENRKLKLNFKKNIRMEELI
ncbi:hypothetical protein [Spirochaeta isovalerica]|uniref:Heparinase II/III-like protein n=1 Tax=Spirochaeta isovalerica TaxID=150 RepID=A0A841RAP7_9SPIO|nr:hypothetical protein [Spirochaeta isovalerica]MBB6480090.1 hypothetical protein [Spirochaeta isovalerica]